jgi:hypothetical protein
MSLLSDLGIEEALRQFRSFRDDQFRSNLANNQRLKALETENLDLKCRLSVLTRLLISKEVFTAAEIAAFIVEVESEAKAQSTTEPASPASNATESA